MSAREVFSFRVGDLRFNYRVAAVIIQDNRLLICREDKDTTMMLPGGRVEHGEPSSISLEREIEEELKCKGKLIRLLFSVEDFFERAGQNCHEIGKYYLVELPDNFPFIIDGPTLITFDEGKRLTFYWVPISGDALAKVKLLPEWIHSRLTNLPDTTVHLIKGEK